LPKEHANGKRPFAPGSAGVAAAAAAAAVSGDAGVAAAGGAAVDLGRGAGVGNGTLSSAAAKPAASMLHAIATRTILAPRSIMSLPPHVGARARHRTIVTDALWRIRGCMPA
jgi:hypothetical protein